MPSLNNLRVLENKVNTITFTAGDLLDRKLPKEVVEYASALTGIGLVLHNFLKGTKKNGIDAKKYGAIEKVVPDLMRYSVELSEKHRYAEEDPEIGENSTPDDLLNECIQGISHPSSFEGRYNNINSCQASDGYQVP